MKIKEIKQIDRLLIYEVTFTPNWLEKLFGIKEYTKKYKRTMDTYENGGGNVYVESNGKRLGNMNYIAEAIETFRRKW